MSTTVEQAPAQPQRFDSKMVIPFVNSIRDVFSKMAKVQTTVDRPFLKEGTSASYDISGIIGFSGEVVGSVVLCFQTVAAVKLVEAFAGMPIDPNTPDFTDAVGELANMVAGAAKKNLEAKASITVPNVVIGKDHHIARLSGVPCLVIPCRSAIGNFAVEVCVKQNNA